MADRSTSEHIFVSGWKNIMFRLSDGTTKSLGIENSACRAIFEDNDHEQLQKVVSNFTEIHGTDGIYVTAVEDIADTSDAPNENEECGEVTTSPSASVTTPSASVTTPSASVRQLPTSFSWQQAGVFLLISLYIEHKSKFESSVYRQRDVWNIISKEMNAKGFKVSSAQCDEKFRSLKHRHKMIKDTNSKTGRGRSTWTYFDAMDDLLAGDPAVQPVRVVASASTSKETPLRTLPPSGAKGNRAPSPAARTNSPVNDIETPVVRKRKRSGSEPPEWFQNYLENNNRRLEALEDVSSKLLEEQRRKNDIFERFVNAYVAKNN